MDDWMEGTLGRCGVPIEGKLLRNSMNINKK